MPVPTKPQDDQNTLNTDLTTGAVPSQAKELEPQRADEKRLLDEVVEASEKQDQEAEQKLQESLGAEARLSQPHPKIANDVAAAGVVSPPREASMVISNGSTIELPISEEEYEAAEKTKIKGSVSNKEVFGVSSLAAFAMFIGRIIKIAHTHAKRIIFRQEAKKDAS